MPKLFLIALLAFPVSGLAQEKVHADFPKDVEIQLLVTQVDRAARQYELLVNQETELLNPKVEDTEKDKQVIQSIDTVTKVLKQYPQRFNGPLGFAYFEAMDDASRNLLLCATTAFTQAISLATADKPGDASVLLHLGQACTDISTLFYTVSESAGALYMRYIEGEEQLAIEGSEVADKCSDILKHLKEQRKP